MAYDGTSNGSMVIPGESAEDYNARLAAWYARKASGDPFPGPQPGYAGSDPTANSANTAVHPDAPGASLSDTQTADDRDRMSGYLQQLQGQAQTGGGAWEQALASHTAQANNVASAVGQSSGLGALTAGQNIGNAQAGNAQREAGQANLLRAQTQQHAQDSLSGVLSGQGAIDAQEAATSAGVKQGVLETNLAARSRANKDLTNYASAAGQGILTAGAVPGKSNGGEIPAYSDGGTVPGQAAVFGDDEANDTVRAKLSPGEIVIPRSITSSPHAAELAAAFVEAVKQHGPSGATNFDGGGAVPSFSADQIDTTSTKLAAPGASASSQQAPSIQNGGLLDTKNYNQTRDANLSNSSNFLQRYAGQGPSVAPQAMQNATDSTINDAMQAQRPGAGHEAGAAAGVGAASQQAQGAAGNAAGIVAGESERGGEMFAQAVQRQRAQDLAMATAQQQAAWRNTMLNSGIGLEQQNQLKGLLGGIGQGAVAAAGLFPKDNSTPSYDANLDGGYKLSEADGTGFEPGSPYGDYSVSDGGYAADGGVIVSRQGTRRKPERPGQPHKGNEPRGLNTVTSESNATPDEWVPFEGRTPPKGGTQTEDTIQQFAGGGPVFEGATSGMPQSGPFTPNASSMSIGDALRTLMLASSPGGGPPVARGTQDDPSAARPAAFAPPGMSHGAPARERPFATPRAAPPAQPTQPTAQPMAAPAPQRPAVATPRAAASNPADPFAMEQKAAEQKASVDAQAGDAQAAVLSGLETKLEANAVQQAEVQARASEAAKSQLTSIQAARDEMKAIDVTVDPDRYTARMGWGGKLASIIGLTLGAIGNDNGVNRAASLLNQQIDRDLDAQKSEHELRLRKGQSAVDSAQNAYSLARQATQDDIAANAAARGTMLDLADNQVKLAAAKFASPQAKANLSALSARIAKEKMESDATVHQRLVDNHIKQQHANAATMSAEASLLAAGREKSTGAAAQSALLATIQTEESTIQKQGEQLLKLLDTYGTGELQSPGVEAKMRQAVDNMATAAAKLKDPASAAKESEVEGERKNIFKPGFFQRTEAAREATKSYMNNAKQREALAFSARGVSSPGGAQPAPVAQQMRLPSGEIVEVR